MHGNHRDADDGSVRTLRVRLPGSHGVAVRVQVHHAAASVTALLATGLGLPLEVWLPVVDLLPDVRVILLDRPGLGGSDPWPDAPQGMHHQVEVLSAALAAALPDHGATPVALVGHSSGALHVEAFARGHPGRVSGLVMVDPALPHAEVRAGRLAALVGVTADAMVSHPRAAGALGPWLGWAVLRVGTIRDGRHAAPTAVRAWFADPDHVGAIWAELRRSGTDAADLAATAAGHPLPDVPVTVLAAALGGWPLGLPRHGWRRRLARRARELSPSGRTVRAGGAHLLMLDDPGTVAAAIARMVGVAPPAAVRP